MMPSHTRKTVISSSPPAISRKPSFTPTSDRSGRTSFSSIHENNSGVAQSFTDSKTSSYLRNELVRHETEEAIDDEVPTPVSEEEAPDITMLNPHSTLHGLVCPCDSFKGWKGISIGGKVASRSFGDLRLLAHGWEWESKASRKPQQLDTDRKTSGLYPPGQSPLEKLPNELLGKFGPESRLYHGTTIYATCLQCEQTNFNQDPS
jgi:hypothetical protein